MNKPLTADYLGLKDEDWYSITTVRPQIQFKKSDLIAQEKEIYFYPSNKPGLYPLFYSLAICRCNLVDAGNHKHTVEPKLLEKNIINLRLHYSLSFHSQLGLEKSDKMSLT